MASRNVWQEKPAEPPALTTSASHRGLAGFWDFAVCGVLSPRHKPPCCSPGIGLARRQPASHFIKPRSCSKVFFFSIFSSSCSANLWRGFATGVLCRGLSRGVCGGVPVSPVHPLPQSFWVHRASPSCLPTGQGRELADFFWRGSSGALFCLYFLPFLQRQKISE